MSKRNREYIETKERVLARVEATDLEGESFWKALIDAVLAELPNIWEEQEDGSVKINWLKVIFSLGRIVGVLVALKEAKP